MSGIEPKHLQSVERYTLLLGALVMGATFLLCSRATSLAASVGVGLMALNAVSLRKISERVSKPASDGPADAPTTIRAGAAVLLFNLKMFALIGLVYLAVKVLGLDAVGFLLGISVFPVAIVAAALKMNLDGDAAESAPSHGENR